MKKLVWVCGIKKSKGKALAFLPSPAPDLVLKHSIAEAGEVRPASGSRKGGGDNAGGGVRKFHLRMPY